jgi:cytochrome c553
VPGICNHDSSTVVLAHVRIPGVTGLAVKSNDLAAMHACNCCHDALDGRTRWPAYLGHKATYILEAMVRTIDAVCREHKLIRL